MWTEMLRPHLYFIYSKYVMFIHPITFPVASQCYPMPRYANMRPDVIWQFHLLISFSEGTVTVFFSSLMWLCRYMWGINEMWAV